VLCAVHEDEGLLIEDRKAGKKVKLGIDTLVQQIMTLVRRYEMDHVTQFYVNQSLGFSLSVFAGCVLLARCFVYFPNNDKIKLLPDFSNIIGKQSAGKIVIGDETGDICTTK
jgi:hypothetical protein